MIKIKKIIWVLMMALILSGCNATQSTSITPTTPGNKVNPGDTTTFESPTTDSTHDKTSNAHKSPSQSIASRGNLTIHYLNVGQGNATLLTCDGKSMLIDGGDRNASSFVVSYLKKQGISTLDYVLVSHYDSDHLNGVVGALHAFSVKNILAPNYTTVTNIYKSFIDTARQKNYKITHPQKGQTYRLGNASFTIVCPQSYKNEDENNNSIGIRLVNGQNRFLFLGDAATESEQEMLSSGLDLSSDVYLVSHHGSAHSTTESFLSAVSPSYAVVSVGKNSYGHPSSTVLNRLKSHGVKLFRTDVNGTIIVKNDGKTLTFNCKPTANWSNGDSTKNSTNKPLTSPTGAKYIGNIRTMKFHLLTCSGLPLEKNRIYFKTRQDAINNGYSPCGRCHP
jgi:beta-lactamase superfamily II metal-dependent hydrolase